ncbi:MAG: hypothetical protein ACI8QC_003681, partial [Planctomycetota bacterium]
SFAPEDGSSVTKTFTSTVEFALDDMTMLMNGEENPMMPSMEMDMNMIQTITVSDKYGATSAGRPATLTRTYDAAGNEMEVEMVMDMMGQVQEDSSSGSGSSALEGSSVVFTWDADAGEYTKAFAEGSEGEDEHLEGLVEDMDLRVLLPDGEVDEGDEWEIDLAGLVDILAPGGDLIIDLQMDGAETAGGPDPTMMSNVREMFGDMLEGSASGKFTGTRDEDGVTVAVIEIEIEIDTAKDMSEFVEELMGDQIPAEVEMTLDRVDVEFALQSSGILLWDIRGGHVYSLSIEGESAVSMDMEMSMDMGGQAMTFEMSMEMSGTQKNEVSIN